LVFPRELKRAAFVTVHPDQVAASALETVDAVIAVGKSPDETVAKFCKAMGEETPAGIPGELEDGQVLLWRRGAAPEVVKVAPARAERHRHVRKYAQGALPPERSFYFKGPGGKLNLRAQNLILFMQLADGVDDETWMYHLREGDYSDWFRRCIKDGELAAEAEEVEAKGPELGPKQSRAQIREAIEKRYTLPASAPLPMPGTDAAPRRQGEGKPG
jgi:hypothetical protein